MLRLLVITLKFKTITVAINKMRYGILYALIYRVSSFNFSFAFWRNFI